MKQNLIDVFFKGRYSKHVRKNYVTGETVAKHLDNNWRSDLIDMMQYGLKKA